MPSRRCCRAVRCRHCSCASPDPRRQQIDLAIDAALRAPDHGALRPWRFVLIRGAARARLSELFVRRMQRARAGHAAGQDRQGAQHAADRAAGDRRGSAPAPGPQGAGSRAAAVDRRRRHESAERFSRPGLWRHLAHRAAMPTIRRSPQALGFDAEERCLGFVYVGSIAAAGRLAAAHRLERAASCATGVAEARCPLPYRTSPRYCRDIGCSPAPTCFQRRSSAAWCRISACCCPDPWRAGRRTVSRPCSPFACRSDWLTYWLTLLLIRPAVLEVVPDRAYVRLRAAPPPAPIGRPSAWLYAARRCCWARPRTWSGMRSRTKTHAACACFRC